MGNVNVYERLARDDVKDCCGKRPGFKIYSQHSCRHDAIIFLATLLCMCCHRSSRVTNMSKQEGGMTDEYRNEIEDALIEDWDKDHRI